MAIVHPVYKAHSFEIDVKDHNTLAEKAQAQFEKISQLETFSVSIDTGVEEYYPFEDEGYVRRLATSKGITISLSGKRDYDTASNVGNEHVADLMFKAGNDAKTLFKWHMNEWKKGGSGADKDNHKVLLFPCVVSVSATGGDSTAIDVLEFDVMSDGKPEEAWEADAT